jgi:hypothetical protein
MARAPHDGYRRGHVTTRGRRTGIAIVAAVVVGAAACGPARWRRSPYQQERPNVRTRGAEPLAREMPRDPAIRRWVERDGSA